MSADAGGIMRHMIEIVPVHLAELRAYPEFPALCRAYAEESAPPQLGPADVDFGLYQAVEDAGRLRLLAAVEAGRLEGFLFMVESSLPHYAGSRVLTIDAAYAAPEARGRGAGFRLFLAAKRTARQDGCTALVASAPAGSRAAEFYRRTAGAEQASFVWRIGD